MEKTRKPRACSHSFSLAEVSTGTGNTNGPPFSFFVDSIPPFLNLRGGPLFHSYAYVGRIWNNTHLFIIFSWVLNTVDKMNLLNPPAIALFPIGTGNDLARSLGYGAGSDSSENVR